MNTLSALLSEKGIRTALIVDDTFDNIPLAADLAVLDRDEWTQFFDDLSQEDKTAISSSFPSFEKTSSDRLIEDDAFVGAVWALRDQLSPGTARMLFDRYVTDQQSALQQLNKLKDELTALGLRTSTCGRNFERDAVDADLILIDLYLGDAQQAADMQLSIDTLARVSKHRATTPPLVILMSSSTRLEENFARFRDQTGLFASAFRFAQKGSLNDSRAVEYLLRRLALYRLESLKLASFVNSWNVGLASASARTTQIMRTLDLPDFGQVHNLLLHEEEAPAGGFFVDVIDRVLQHQVESESGIIAAAKDLDSIDFASYAPRYVGDSPDLQRFVYQSTFQHPARLRLKGSVGSNVAFGDLLIPKGPESMTRDEMKRLEVDSDSVFAVLTPACSLQRGEAKRVLLLRGTCKVLTARDWFIKDTPIRVPVFEMPDGGRRWIKWDIDHVETISVGDLNLALEVPDGLQVGGRLRDLYAVELQQKLLSHLGRVGVSAPLPATFEVDITVFLPGTDGRLVSISSGSGGLKGVVFMGRREDELQSFLSVAESDCLAIWNALRDRQHDDTLHPTSVAVLKKFFEDKEYELLQSLEKGCIVKNASTASSSLSLTKVPFSNASSNADGQGNIAFFVTRSSAVAGASLPSNQMRESPVVIAISECDSDSL